MRIGIDNIKGYVTLDVLEQFHSDNQRLAKIEILNFDEVVNISDNVEYLILNVRNKYQYDMCHIPKAVNILYTNLTLSYDNLPRDRKLLDTVQPAGLLQEQRRYSKEQDSMWST